MKTILITGSSGSVGTKLVEFLRNDYQLIGIDIHESRNALDRFYQGKISKQAKIAFKENEVDLVIHLAAFIYVGESEEKPLEYYSNNVSESLCLFEEMHRANVTRLIFNSSSSLYIPSECLSEDSPTGSNSVYAKTKLFVETIIQDLPWMSYFIFRPSNILGTVNPKGDHHLLPIVVRKITERESITINGRNFETPDRTCVRDYIHVHDLLKAYLKGTLILFDHKVREIINIGSGKSWSNLEVIQTSMRVLDQRVPILFGDARKGDVSSIIFNISKAKKILDWEPTKSLEEMILDTRIESEEL